MKLSRRIRDLVRATLRSPRRSSDLGRAKSSGRLEAQLEQIRISLTRATAREKQLQDNLALAEQEGHERDAVRLRRELASLAASSDELQSALDLIEARVEMEREIKDAPPAKSRLEAQEQDMLETTGVESKDEADLTARKSRLSAPPKKPQ